MAARKVVLQLGVQGLNASPVNKFQFKGSTNFYRSLSFDPSPDKMSQDATPSVNRVFLVDTHALAKGLEGQGSAITDRLENVSHSFVSKPEMQKIELLQEVILSKFKSKVQSSLEKHSSQQQNDIVIIKNEPRSLDKQLSTNDREVVHELRTLLGTTKYEVLKYFLGAFASLLAACTTLACMYL